MTKIKILLLIALLLSLTTSLNVRSVTLQNAATTTSLQGSIMGGTKLYIQGLGFSQVMDENMIYVGDYPCRLEDGATVTAIVCSTTAPGQYKQYLNLDVVVIVEGQGAVVAPQKFSYTYGQTPYVYSVSPSVSYGGKGTKLFFYGSHRIFELGGDKDLGDVYGIYVGDSLCSRFGIFQDQIGPNGAQFIQCYQATLQKAGKYNVSQHLFPGRSTSYELTWKASLDNNDKFQFVVLPLVNATTHSGSKDGQQLLIKGTGFSLDLKDVSVQVDGVNCKVTESTFTEVRCTLEPKMTQQTNLTTSQTAPTNNFISGSGFFYERYSIASITPQTVTRFKQLLDTSKIVASTLQDQSVSGQIKTQNTFGANYGQVWKGYFAPKVSGPYKFRGLADDAFAVFLTNETYGSTVSFVNVAPIAYSNSAQAQSFYSNYYLIDYPSHESQYIQLQAGRHYYMQAYHINKINAGYFSLSVQVPNTDTKVQRWQLYQVHQIGTSMMEQPQVIEFTSKGVNTGTISLRVYQVDPTSLQTLIDRKVTIPWNANATELCTKLNQFSWFSTYTTTCTVKMIDSTGTETTDRSLASQLTWRASIAKFRPPSAKAHVFKVTYLPAGGVWASKTVQEHSPQMSGTFTIQIGGVPIKLYNTKSSTYSIIDIPFNVNPSTLKSAFRQINGFQYVQVQRNGDPTIGSKWFIYYKGYNKDLPELIVSGAGLKGGKSGSLPQVNTSTKRNFTTNLFVDPIDYRWMNTYSDKPNVRVTVSGIPSACNGDCSYTFVSDIPVLTAASLSGYTLSLTIQDAQSLNAPLTAISVTLDNQPCTSLTGTMTSFTCVLPKNSDDTPILRAGIHMPVVKISPIGSVKVGPTVNPITVNLALTSATPAVGGVNGGYQVTLAGTGFPTQTSQISFKLCSKICTINSLNNIQAIVTIPSCETQGDASIEAIFGATQNTAFTYNSISSTVQVTAISPTSWSPVMKGVMHITGVGFGTDPSTLKVYLTNSSGNIYQMKILETTDIMLKAGIPGGLPGNFDVNVIKTGFGNAIANPTSANDFVYEVVITGVSPNAGSIGGGTLITIQGRNFVPDKLDTLVHIGNQLNQLCKIESITSTQIICRTPQKNLYYNVSEALPVTVDSKLIISTNCSNPTDLCFFSYIAQVTSPLLESLSSGAIVTGVLTLTGQRLNIGTSAKVSLTNKITGKTTEVTPISANETQIKITLPSLESGVYAVRARADPTGQSNFLLLTVNMNIANITPMSLSVNGGQVKIIGSGFPQKWPNSYFNKLSFATGGRNLPLIIKSISTTQIVLEVPKGTNLRSYTFTITNPMGIVKSIGFSQQTTSTPNVNIISAVKISPNVASTITLNRTNMITTAPETIQIYSLINPNYIYNISTWANSSSQISFSVTLNSGKYGFRLYDNVYGWYSTSETTVLSVQKSGNYVVSPTQTSFNGGLVTVTGDHIGDGAIIKVNGLKGTVQSRTASEVVFSVPKLVTSVTQSIFKLAKNKTINLSNKVKWGDSIGWQAAFDSEHSSMYSSNNSECSVGIDIGENLGVQITRVRLFPNPTWQIASQYIKGALVQVSDDNTTWATIATVDQTVHAGWNSFMINDAKIYRYIRFSHNSTSKCNIAQLQLNGIVMSSATVSLTTSFLSDIKFDDGFNAQTFTAAVQYREDHTPIVTGVTPDKGDVFGGNDITLSGVYFDIGTPVIKIDGITCVVKSSTATQIVCTVASRLALPTEVSFSVQIGGIPAIIEKQFRYVMRWSDHRTWGTDLPPVDNDLVYIPHGMHLLVDQSTPLLKGIIVENGTIEFADESDMTIRAQFITLRGGQFIAGTEQDDYDNKLTFIMYGSYFGAQQPMFGNKGIGCLECKFSMIGQKRTPTWTMIDSSITAGENQFTTIEDIDWRVGEQIVVASTSYDHNEAEQRVITSISGRTITVDKSFKYSHYAGVQTYGTSDKLQMRAEVGLLTRNIVMMGDQTSIATDYGSHLMLTGSAENGLVGKIAYTQFTKCGQPQIVGRYCHHFHMSGDVPESYSIGNSVHHSMARILTLHGVHFLYVAWNVGYRVKGHNFFIEDGVETNNVLQYNLAISSLLVNNMLQTDMSVASFWVTNPTNHLRYNHAAGSDFYGFWYEIKEHPDGPSATEDVCPIGNPLGESHDNVAHSNVRFGLRIFQLYSRQNPCQPIRNDKLVDPWSQNPSIESKFYNYVLWKNGQAGLLAEEVGNMIFENFTIAESKLAGMEFYKTNFTKETVIARNFAIIGKSISNPPASDSQLAGSKGAILPRTGQIKFQKIRFYSFTPLMTVWQACSKCDNPLLYTNIGAVYYAKNISYSNIQGAYFTMLGQKREVFYDTDGTLTNGVFDTINRTSATLMNGWKHILQDPSCKNAQKPSSWDNGALCNQNVSIRKVAFTNILDQQVFKDQKQKAKMISDINQVTSWDEKKDTQIYSLQGKMQPKQMKFTYSLPYLTNRTYDIQWGKGIDFEHIAMVTSHLFEASESAILFKFSYIDNRELYQISPLRQGRPFNYSLIKLANSDPLASSTCQNGDYYHNNADGIRVLELCASGKNRSYFEYIDINAVYCRYLCPAPPGSCAKQKTIRNWNNATQWPNGSLPVDGDNITIPCQWTVLIDMNPANINYFEINGDVIIPNIKDIKIVAQNIWIKGGSLKAGLKSQPFTHNLTIQMTGNKKGKGFTVSPDLTGNKMFVVTGRLELFGVAPSSVWTRMTSFADKGATSITVASAAGWKIGDQIGIAPSFTGQTQFQKVTITVINSNTVTFTPALNFSHYGDASATITKSFGTMDMRTGVAHLTRNIKITSGNDEGWGFSLVQFGYSRLVQNVTVVQTGKMTLSGVQFIKGGQYDTEQAGLQIFNVRAKTEHTIITKSSFHECQDFCMKINNAYDLEITNNVFFNARKFHVKALKAFNYNFTNNLMIGVTKRQQMVFKDLIACFASYETVNPLTDLINVTKNLCQGSQGNGFAVPHVSCDDIDIYPFAENTAGSCDIGWIFSRGQGTCLAAKGVYAYGSQIGQIHNPVSTLATKFKNFILADNVRSMTIRIGGESADKTGFIYDSFITGIARPSCSKCYGLTTNKCTGNHGVRMLTTGSNGQNLPDKFGHDYDVVCKQQTIDGKVFIYDTQFSNFRQSYPTLPQCSNNVIFRPHTAGSDITGSHYLFDSTCTNCEISAYGYFAPPPAKQLGWFGGCGDILCTGNNNYLIHDYTGTFLPTKGVLLANNSWIGDNTPGCTKISQINGHYCTDQDFGVLQYESIAPDFNTRIMWPVNLKFDGGNWTSITNGWKEWQWNGGQPLNKRLGRFVSIVKLHKTYNMTFSAMPPEDMTLKIQNRLPQGNSSDWVIVKLHYPKPNSIRVEVNGKTMKPISLLNKNVQQPLNTSVCGSNIFFYKNYTVHLVITGDPNCKVRVSLSNSIQLTTKFDMDIDDFFRDDGVTKFINRLSALLSINDTSRIKVVGIYNGSVQIDSIIQPTPTLVGSSGSTSQADVNAQKAQIENLQAQLNGFVATGALATAMTSAGFGNLAAVSATILGGPTADPTADPTTDPTNNNTLNPTPDNSNQSSTSNNTGMIVGIVLGATFFIGIAFVGTVCYIRKKAKIGQFNNQQIPFQGQSNKQAQSRQKIASNADLSLMELKHKKKELF